MAARHVEEAVERIVAELLSGQDVIELVDVEYVKEHDWYLRVFIDREGGIEIDDCQNLSERLEKELDKQDHPIVFMLWGRPAQEKMKMLTFTEW